MIMTFKEKKKFYKERQKFFDAVKLARQGEFPVVTYNGERYRLVYVEDFYKKRWDNQYLNKRHGFAVIYSKKYKSNTIVEWCYGSKYGFTWISENGKPKKGNYKKILCFAEKIN
jgi:hypothetical protein